ncbi:MAG TPA: DUF349 domain-containing protein, partial [Kofleriaceae bacterium]|nr:DUF349 domain-containing protein [Kofleriaceae bacterium]
MALGDLFRPKHKHSDAAVRAEAVRALGGEDAELLAEIARSDDDPRVRRIAVDKLTDPDLLAQIAGSEPDPSVRAHARSRAVDRFLSSALSGQGDLDGAILWLAGLDEQRPLAQLACRAPTAQHRRRALEKMSDPRALAEVVREAREQDVALSALARLDDVELLRSLAMDLDSRDRGAAVVDRIEDDGVLSAVAARAKNKGVRARANKRLQARRQSTGGPVPGVTMIEPQSWQQQQRVQLVRLLEERARGDEWVESQREVTAAEEVWQRLGPGEDPDLSGRFTAALQRYRSEVARRAPAGQSNGAAAGARAPVEVKAAEKRPPEQPEREPVPVEGHVEAQGGVEVAAQADPGGGSGNGHRPDEPAVPQQAEPAAPQQAEPAAPQAEPEVRDSAPIDRAPIDDASAAHVDAPGPAPHAPDDHAEHAPGDASGEHAHGEQAHGEHAHGEQAHGEHAHGEQRPRAAREAPATEAERNLAALEALSADLERAVASENVKLSTAEKKLKQAETRYPTLLVLPPGLKRKAMERFQEARRHLFIKVGELREVEDWKRWANVPKQEELIKLVEGLIEAPDTGHLAQQLKDAQNAWKDVGPAPREKGQELWQRFKAACDKLYDRVKQHRAHQTAEQKDHLRLKLELCARAEELADSEDWGPAADALKKLQAEWKTIGPVPRKQADEVWKRFRAACDRFFERRRPHVEKAFGERQANLDAKQALVDQAEALAAVAVDAGAQAEVDWDAALRTIGELRREWRRVGPIPQREYEAFNQRFIVACDRVAQLREEARALRQAERRGVVETAFAEAEAALDSGAEGLADLVMRARAAVRDLEGEGVHASDLRQRADALCRRAVAEHAAAFKGTDLDPDQTRKRKERLYARVAELASRAGDPQATPASGALTAEQMAAKLRAALAERALGGVLARDAKPVRQVVAEA